jgi:prepilin-type N-terminal cleavage/methylation domain-containing protein
MIKLNSRRNRQQGFTLIEVMVAFAVLAFGLLAIGSFQAKLVSGSGYSKARAEAVAIAQQKLDEIRSYVNQPQLVANLSGSATITNTDSFPADIADGDYPAVADLIQGTNAEFSRQWNVAVAGDVADVAVTVTWDDPSQGTQSVVLDTSVTWRNPRGSADLTALDEPLVPSATGRAYLGDGHIDPADIPGDKDNGDGTSDADFDNDGDLELVDNNSGDVVLTLRDACNIETGVCTDFVRIQGYVAIDNVASNMNLSDVYVLASDAAYCARDLVTNTGTTGPNGNYDYYKYTCYLGGGWHGNIGLLMSGANSNDTACVGDPYADPGNGAHKWRRYELAKRRVYRGMLHKVDDDGDEITNANGDTLFYSQGIADATLLPDPAWPAREYPHSFVVTRVTGAGTGGGTAADCLAALTRADNDPDNNPATANLFDGSANDFVCLNADNVPNVYADGVDPNIYSSYLDYFDPDIFRARNDCPYDPSDPPSWRFTISGVITTGDTPSSMSVLTSDGTDNCSWTTVGTATSYSCDVYAWENADHTINGWGGTIMVTPPADMLCAINPVDAATVYTNPVSVVYADVDGSPLYEANQHYTCSTLTSMQVSGTITAIGSDLAEGQITANDGSDCTYASAGETATYSCTVIESAVGAGWTGTITFIPPSFMAADACTPTSWTFDTPLYVTSTDNNSICSVPQPADVYGWMATTTGVDLSTINVMADGVAGSCYVGLSTNYYYWCNVTHYGSGWSGTITFDSGDPDVRCTPDSYTPLAAVIGSAWGATPVSCEVDLSGTVVVEGYIQVYDLARTTPLTPVMKTGGVVDGSCVLNNGVAVASSGTNVKVPYHCTTPIIAGDAVWASGSVTFSDSGSKVICVDDTHPNPRLFSSTAPRTTLFANAMIFVNQNGCPETLP